MTAWLASLDPRVVRGLFAVVGTLFASGTALYIALSVYPTQKELDRQNEMRRERRAVYGAFLRELVETQILFARIRSVSSNRDAIAKAKSLDEVEKFKERFAGVFGSLQVLSLSSSPAVFLAASKCFASLSSALDEALNRMHKEANLDGGKGDQMQNPNPSASPVSANLDEAIRRVWLTMRAEEFSENQDEIDDATRLLGSHGIWSGWGWT